MDFWIAGRSESPSTWVGKQVIDARSSSTSRQPGTFVTDEVLNIGAPWRRAGTQRQPNELSRTFEEEVDLPPPASTERVVITAHRITDQPPSWSVTIA